MTLAPAPDTADAPQFADLRHHLLAWYAHAHRDFPWRGLSDPYAVLVSEVMLQQTQAARVAERFPRWMDRYPIAASLAAAPVADVLAAWSGLGYNRRALALQRTAAALTASGWPRDVAGLERLPGIGPYTARAIASLAFGVPVGVVDTNVRRWLLRRFAGTVADRPRELQALADTLATGPGDPASWTHASMEFGANVCRARSPRCDVCPIQRSCPSRGTAAAVHVPRQSAFRGSERAYRGALLRRLADASPAHRVTEAKARAALDAATAHIGPPLDDAGWAPPRSSDAGGHAASVRRGDRSGAAAIGRYNRRVSRRSSTTLKVRTGDQIPSVGLRASDGYLLNLRTFVTKQPVALVFFGAGTMAGAARRTGHKLTDALATGHDRLREAGIAVVGVSCDSAEQQRAYIDEHRLPFLLFSDERRSAVQILGVPMVNDGTNYNVAQPVVLAVDADGAIRAVLEKPDPERVVDAIVRAFVEPLPGPLPEPAATPDAPVEDSPRLPRAEAPDDRPASDTVGEQPAPATGSADPSAPAQTAEEPRGDPHREPPETQRGPAPTEPQVPEH